MRLWVIGGFMLLGAGCGGEVATARPPELSPWSGPLPSSAQLLPFETYDCRAAGLGPAATRPQPLGCFADHDCTAPLVVGHRMATPFAPENSLAALRAAIRLGVDMVETDLRMTSDGHVVLLHDGSVDRTTTGTGAIGAYTLAELKTLSLKDGPDGGRFDCEGVPTLVEAAALSRDKIVLELEVKETQAGVEAARYLKAEGLYGQALLLCDPAECAAIRSAVPDAPIMTRPHRPSEVQAALDYDPAPVMVHIDPTEAFTATAVLDQIHGVGAKVYASGFVLGDAQAAFADDLEGYRKVWGLGIEVQQVENPHWALMALSRLKPGGDE